MSFNPFARMQIKSFGENIRESSQMGKIEHFFFFGLFVAKLIHRFYIVIVPLFFSLRRMMRSDRFFFFFFVFIRDKGERIDRNTEGIQHQQRNTRELSLYFVLNNHKCGREKNVIYLFNFAFDTGTSAPIIDLLDSRIIILEQFIQASNAREPAMYIRKYTSICSVLSSSSSSSLLTFFLFDSHCD